MFEVDASFYWDFSADFGLFLALVLSFISTN